MGNRPVALKVLLKHLLNDPQFLMRFQTEAAVTGRLFLASRAEIIWGLILHS